MPINVTERLLVAIRDAVTVNLMPELSSPMAKATGQLVSQLLTHMMADRADRPALDAARQAALSPLLAEARTIMAQAGHPSLPVQADNAALDAELETLLPAMLRRAAENPALHACSAALLNQLVDVEWAAAARVASVVAQRGQMTSPDAAGQPITAERLQDYLAAKFPGRRCAVTALQELPGGFGKTTVLAEVNGLEDGPARLVLRRDQSSGVTGTTVVDEFPLLTLMYAQGAPVPEPLWLEPDASKLDQPFVVMKRVSGRPAGGIAQPDHGVSTAETARDLARALARLHAIDPCTFPASARVPAVGSAREAMQASLRSFGDQNRRLRLAPDPLMECCLAWLELNIPAGGRLCIVHGDAGFHNLLADEGRLTALLDWELAHLGDAAEDLAYVRAEVEQFLPWEEFLDVYRQAGGAEFLPQDGLYYQVWRGVRNAIYAVYCMDHFLTGRNSDLRFASAFPFYYHAVLNDAARIMLAHGAAAPAQSARVTRAEMGSVRMPHPAHAPDHA